jgi:TonB family protein
MKWQLFLICVLASLLCAQDSRDDASKAEDKKSPVGYVDCSNREKIQLTPVYLDLCEKHAAGNLECGQSLSVVERRDLWLKVSLPGGSFRYVPLSVISKSASTFVSFDKDPDMPDLGLPGCPVLIKQEVPGPRLIFDPAPEYSDLARKKKINGKVILSLTVGTDGLPHDIQIKNKLGYGLDEKALDAVRKWKFEPALRDGQPVETRIDVSVSFKLM